MNNIHNIIAVGGHDDNQSRFLTQIKPVKLEEDAEIALTSIFTVRYSISLMETTKFIFTRFMMSFRVFERNPKS